MTRHSPRSAPSLGIPEEPPSWAESPPGGGGETESGRECPTNGSQKRQRRPYRRSGLYALKAPLHLLGPRRLDGRTHMAKQVACWRAELVRDLGGDAVLSTQERWLVDVAVRL